MPKQLSTLDLNGNLTLAGASGTSGQVLTSGGTGFTPTWTTVSGGGSGTFTFSATAPTSPAAGDRWTDSSSGTTYTYVNDGTSLQWAELGVSSTFSPIYPATVAPLIDGTAAVGTSTLYARQDHVHPTDTTLVPKTGDSTITGTTTLAASSATSVPLVITPFSGQTVNQISATGFSIERGGALSVQPTTAVNGYASFFKSPSAGVAGVMIRGAASQTANLQEWQDSTPALLSYVKPNGSIFINSNNNTAGIEFLGTGGNHAIRTNGNDLNVLPYFDMIFGPTASSGRLRPANDNTSDLGTSGQRWKNVYASGLIVTNSTAANTVATIKGAASQTANLQEWQNSAGTILANIQANGNAQFNSGLASYYSFSTSSGGGSVVPLAVTANSAQVADLAQYKTSGGTILGGRNAVGQAYTGSTTPVLSATGGTIQSIATGANPLVTMASAHGFSVGDLVTLASTTGATYDGTFVIATVPLTTTFTITSALTTGQASAAGTASLPAQKSITARSPQTKALVVRPASSLTTNIFEVQQPGTEFNPYLSIDRYGIVKIFGNAMFTSSYNGAIPLTVTGVSGQTADLLQIKNSSGTVIGGTNAVSQTWTGSTTTLKTTAVATTAASASSATVATYTVGTVSTVNPYAVGQLATTAGFTAETYFNGTFAITAIGGSSGAWTFTVAGSGFTVASATVQGTVSIPVQSSITTSSAGTTGLVVKGTTSQTANLQEWQNSAGVIQASIGSSGALYVNNDSTLLGLLNVGSSALAGYQMTVTCFPSLATRVGALIRGGNSQTADLLQYATSGTAVLGGTNAVGQTFTGSTAPILSAVGGTIQSIATGANPLVTMASAHNLAIGDLVTLAGTTGSTYNGTFVVATVPLTTTFTITTALTAGQAAAGGTVSVPAQASITARSAGTPGLIVKGASSQSASMQVWQDSSGATLAAVDTSGFIRYSGSKGSDGLTIFSLGNNRAFQLFSATLSLGGGAGVLGIANATTVPTSNPTGGGVLYVDTGALKYIGTSGTAATIVNADGTVSPSAGTTSTAATGAGYMGLPQNATTTGSYTVVAADAGKHIYASATRTVTIDSNANLALPIGTTLTFIAGTGATMTIAITTDTMYLAGAGTTGSRTLAAFGMATAVKITSTSWMISGNGLT